MAKQLGEVEATAQQHHAQAALQGRSNSTYTVPAMTEQHQCSCWCCCNGTAAPPATAQLTSDKRNVAVFCDKTPELANSGRESLDCT
ncbi:hypothetical protein ANCDUO_19173 [Ancylostoma duodenale]|uniref:Uncharacterized protein n=1 Tax=Ancylostoma duodenale TaxID=51022 RepID=A0A0C2G112_9BILA|nr:hypothetical protein ANCDUO_19173 [Ancylostoma duodenale]